jgi:hypothetical protein
VSEKALPYRSVSRKEESSSVIRGIAVAITARSMATAKVVRQTPIRTMPDFALFCWSGEVDTADDKTSELTIVTPDAENSWSSASFSLL